MSVSLPVMRERQEAARFGRQGRDDARTAIPPEAVQSLAEQLKRTIDGEVRFDKGTRALYATDGSNYRQVPIGVVVPRHVEDVEMAIRAAREHGAPVLSRGGGTSLAGQCCNVAVILDFSKYMHRVIDIDAGGRLGRVQPGCVLDHFRRDGPEGSRALFRAGPGDAQPLHNWRDAGE